jgi:DNA helicase II / ATP-dependent DNA helicase PcrA
MLSIDPKIYSLFNLYKLPFFHQKIPFMDVCAIDFKSALNAEQYAAVTAPDGPALVLAGAGSGKTRTLTYRVAYLISQNVRPDQILLLTFTNKASKEMLARVEDLTGIPGHHFWGGTFHHIGQKTLRFYGESIGIKREFTILDQNDAEALLTDCIREDNPAFLRGKDNPKPRVLAEIASFARNTQRTIDEVMDEKYEYFCQFKSEFKRWHERYNAIKIEKQTLDYDDLLELWLKLLKTDTQTREYFQRRFRHILVDEYQDTNKLQSALIDTLAANHQVMAVGDDAQCIYTWRGASFENIMTFPDRHPETTLHKIEINYRSSPEILALANEVLKNEPAHQAYHKELRAVRPSLDKPICVACHDARDQAAYIVREIRLLRADGISFNQVGILYRAHFQAMDLQMELSKQGIPYTITSGVRFFEQAHVRDLVAQLRFAWNPQDTVAFLRIASLLPKVGPRTAEKAIELATVLGPKNGKTLIGMLSEEPITSKIPAEARESWIDLAYTLQNIEEALHPPKPSPVKEKPIVIEQGDLFDKPLLAKAPVPAVVNKKMFEAKTPAETVQIAIDGWYGDFLKQIHANWISRREDLDSLVNFAARFESMGELLSQLVLLNSETTDKSIDPDQETIRLTTVHQAKGLEYPVVFVIGAADGLFPLQRAIDEENIEEERRLFYVAVTRAQEKLYITFPRLSIQYGPPQILEPSRFIQELPDEVYSMVRFQNPNARSDSWEYGKKKTGGGKPHWKR